jgi:hypothetical protein
MLGINDATDRGRRQVVTAVGVDKRDWRSRVTPVSPIASVCALASGGEHFGGHRSPRR